MSTAAEFIRGFHGTSPDRAHAILAEGFKLGVRKRRREEVHFATEQHPELALGFAYNRTREELSVKGRVGNTIDDMELPIIIVEVPLDATDIAGNKSTFTVDAEHIGLIVVKNVVHLPFELSVEQVQESLLSSAK